MTPHQPPHGRQPVRPRSDKPRTAQPRPAGSRAETPRRTSQRPTPGLLEQRPLDVEPQSQLPAVHLRSVSYHPFLYRKMIARVDDTAKPGDLVDVYTPQGQLFGHGLYNPRAEMTVRMLQHGSTPPQTEFWRSRLASAANLRRDLLQLDAQTDAYRLVHAESDGLPGIMIDRYGDVLSAETFSLGMFQRSQALLNELAGLLGTRHTLVQVAPQTHGQEGFLADPLRSPELPRSVIVHEQGTRFRVNFEGGHKTGFFCDQRENRQQLATFCRGRTVLDLCCYTGGFAVQAARLGGASAVTAVDLDETAIELAKANARLNQVKINFVHADAFGYMRDMIQNGRQFDVVVLDPPKLIRSRKELDEGRRKHFDLNRLAMQLVSPGGLLLSCTCSGLLLEDDFLRLLRSAARQAGNSGPAVAAGQNGADRGNVATTPAEQGPGRPFQILSRTGAAADHPVAAHVPETEYLKAVWMRML